MSAHQPRQAPDFKKIRSYMRTDHERQALEHFITEGWTAAELGEYARPWRFNNKTYPTAEAYRLTVTIERRWASSDLKQMRAPGYVLPPFDRPDDDGPDNPDHDEETRAAVETLARRVMARNDDRRWGNFKRGPDAPIPKKLWKTCYRDIRRFGSVEAATDRLGLRAYCA